MSVRQKKGRSMKDIDGIEYFERKLSKEYQRGVRRWNKTQKHYRRNVVLPLWRLAVARKILIFAMLRD